MINSAHKANFETLRKAFDDGAVALVEATENATGNTVVLICAVNYDDEEYLMTPFAVMVDGNPYETFTPPI